MRKSLFGYAKTTKAIAKSGGWDIYDDGFNSSDGVVDEFGNNLLSPLAFEPKKSSLEIPSPGFPPNHILIKSAQNLISEYDYFATQMPKSIWISGTNGKTTTTQMCEFLLKNRGAISGGNIGTPLADMDKSAKMWILETSSFSIHYTKTATPEIYALLPVSADHISWHGSFKEYEAAKLKPVFMMREGSVAILPHIYANSVATSKIAKIFYENASDLAAKIGVNIDKISFKEPFLLDALIALAIEKILFDSANIDLLNSFKIEAHKLEELFDDKNRLWVNDTKATNIDAVLAALNRYKDRKIHLILGGDDKGVSLEPLFKEIKKYSCEIYAIGSNCDKICRLADDFGIKHHCCKNLANAVATIADILYKNEVALLSPACASLDQFSSYAHRGEVFKDLISKL